MGFLVNVYSRDNGDFWLSGLKQYWFEILGVYYHSARRYRVMLNSVVIRPILEIVFRVRLLCGVVRRVDVVLRLLCTET